MTGNTSINRFKKIVFVYYDAFVFIWNLTDDRIHCIYPEIQSNLKWKCKLSRDFLISTYDKWNVVEKINEMNWIENTWDEINRKNTNKWIRCWFVMTINYNLKCDIFTLVCCRFVSGHLCLSYREIDLIFVKTNPNTYALLVKLYWCS